MTLSPNSISTEGTKHIQHSPRPWPERDGEFADQMNTMPKDVATATLHELGGNATALTGDVPAAVTDLKKGAGGPILVAGSATLMSTLLAHRLVDELRLMVLPGDDRWRQVNPS